MAENIETSIPMRIRAPGLKMSPSSVQINMHVPTIFIGVIDNDYTAIMWNNDAGKMCKLFSCALDDAFILKLQSEAEDEECVDSDVLNDSMEQALQYVNSKQAKCIRIVRIGAVNSTSIKDALQSLIEGWSQPPDQKDVIFVTCGDSYDFDTLRFCKTLCLTKKCNSLEYYDTLDYNSFGFFDQRKQNLREFHATHDH